MAIEFKHRGRIWRTDTVEEAITLRRRLEAEDFAAFESGEDLPDDFDLEPTAWTHDAVTDLLKGAGALQKKFLRTLAEEGQITSEDLLSKLSLDSVVSLAGVLSGLSKQLKKLGIKPWSLYTVRVQWIGKSKTRSFSLVNQFRTAAAELGWPDKWP
jgi:hypothetical protein